MLLAAGAIADASLQPHGKLGALAIASLVVLTGSVAWRRAGPVRATVVAISGFIAFELATRYNGDGTFEVAAIALNFYTLGRRSRARGTTVLLGVVFGYWLVGTAVATYVPGGGTLGALFLAWALAGLLPFAIGRTLAARLTLVDELEAATARLLDEQEVRARAAAAEERNRMARELHDVIAHCMSVMVVQTGAARRVGEIDAARAALLAVERSGREALVELRRIVGALRRDGNDLAAPGLSGLGELVDRSRATGLLVELRVEGQPGTLSPGLDLVAYRIVQEALTNTIKHAGAARAEVTVKVGSQELELEVSDTGRGPVFERATGHGSGQGLVGISERVKLYGGRLHTGPKPGGGFEVCAQFPLDGGVASSQPSESPVSPDTVEIAAEPRFRRPWLDPVLAGMLLAVLETGVLTASHRRGPLVLNVIVVAGVALAAVWRRQAPLLFLIIVGVLVSLMNIYLIELKNSPVISAYFVLVPTYTVAAWAQRREAAFGLALSFAGAAVAELIVRGGRVGDFAGAAFTLCAAWATGRAIRSYRLLTSELKRTSARLALERDDRERLAVAGERSRIARELHAVIARLVDAMVVQAEVAVSQLGHDSRNADAAMDAIESTGREALGEMRRVLGVLRHGEDRGDLAPQPGVDQIYALIQHARERGLAVELTVDGDPGTLAPGVELGLYRILESALQSIRDRDGGTVAVSLRFGDEFLELSLTAQCDGPNGWPTNAMRERVALCGGRLDPDGDGADGWRLRALMPHGLQGAFA